MSVCTILKKYIKSDNELELVTFPIANFRFICILFYCKLLQIIKSSLKIGSHFMLLLIFECLECFPTRESEKESILFVLKPSKTMKNKVVFFSSMQYTFLLRPIRGQYPVTTNLKPLSTFFLVLSGLRNLFLCQKT